jgi:hypothetical protein
MFEEKTMRKPYQRPTLKRFGDIRELTLLFAGWKDSGGIDSILGRLLPEGLVGIIPPGTDFPS